MEADHDALSQGAPVGPDGEPARVVDEGVREDCGGAVVGSGEGANPHAAHLHPTMLSPREQGDMGEIAALRWLAMSGAQVALSRWT
jgi:hypothetical protein